MTKMSLDIMTICDEIELPPKHLFGLEQILHYIYYNGINSIEYLFLKEEIWIINYSRVKILGRRNTCSHNRTYHPLTFLFKAEISTICITDIR